MSLAAVLAQHGLTVDIARQFVLQHTDQPGAVYAAAQQLKLTTAALAELAGVQKADVHAFLTSRGLDPAALDALGQQKTDYVFLSDLTDGDIFLYNPATAQGRKVFSFNKGITDIAVAANGDIYATDFSSIYRYEFATGALSAIGSHGGDLNSLATHDGYLVAASFINSRITVLDPVNGSQVTSFTLPGGEAAGDIVFVGDVLYRTTINNGLYRSDLSTGESKQVAGALAGNYFGLTLSPSGDLVGFSGDGDVLAFEPGTASVRALPHVNLVGLNTVSGAAEVTQDQLLAFL